LITITFASTKASHDIADVPHMVNPISSNISHASEAAKPAAPKPQPTQQKSTPQPSDTVTLKSTQSAGDVDHDGDSH
ncbi:MAG: hypothetical protein WA423_14020, partial [Candidatus Sulfotelmatobacter sp.]